jgi:protein-S-isoprenylcysteine O-methyltransferase Ste14
MFVWVSWLPAALLIACLGSFTWAIRGFFTQPAGYTGGMKVITVCGAAFGVLHLFAILTGSKLTAERSLAGSLLYLGAAGLFWWTIRTSFGKTFSGAFSPDTPVHLLSDGPYRFVRHPFYSSYILTWIAGCVITAQWWLIPSAAVMIVIYFVASSAEQEKFLRSPLADSYRQYRRRTGRFVPNLVKLLADMQSQTEPQMSEPRP